MFIILPFFASLRKLQSIPLSSPLPDGLSISSLDFCDTQLEHFGHRSVNDIVISCFATIFASSSNDDGVRIASPEVVTAWAFRQHLAAKEIMEEYVEIILKANTREHTPGFFLNAILGLFKDALSRLSSQQGPR
ncbi:hypothetical protein BDN70DRAFT_995946 [Pholiota conissans]|uniref:Uncharacterized protein n=1 Tax=Pholiota conissans TaxID=109636 RepID=A0A9P5YUJ9_9AGAR|nr:hypothetical protein BDN70DRAFT_995946 [Pholiota conissans]